MNVLSKFLSWNAVSILRGLHFWIIITLVVLITFLYYALQFYRIAVFEIVPVARSLVTWEYIHNVIGSLLYIPLLYSMILWWRRTLIIWALSIVFITPHIVYFFNDNFARIIGNVFYLSIPLLLLAYINLQLKWSERERKISYEKEKERQNYLDQIFKAEEDERKRIAQEIHDDSIQRLAVIATDAQLLTCTDQVKNLPVVKNKAESIRDMIISVSHDLRRLSLDLRPTVLDDLGLVPALRWLVDGFQQKSGIYAQIEAIGENTHLSKKYTVNIFRIVQEALSNIQKHSEATNVFVKLQFIDKSIKLTIQDNGKGFVLPKNAELTAQAKLGLLGMQQRAQFLNGSMILQSQIGKGTIVSVEVYL
jgi:signal transduction histidine kinase